jgi:hypothetical protein
MTEPTAGVGGVQSRLPATSCHTRGAAASPSIHRDLLSSCGAGDAYRVLTPIAARVPMPTTLDAPFLKNPFTSTYFYGTL